MKIILTKHPLFLLSSKIHHLMPAKYILLKNKTKKNSFILIWSGNEKHITGLNKIKQIKHNNDSLKAYRCSALIMFCPWKKSGIL